MTVNPPFDKVDINEFADKLVETIFVYDEEIELGQKEARSLIAGLERSIIKTKTYVVMGIDLNVSWTYMFADGRIKNFSRPEIKMVDRDFSSAEKFVIEMRIRAKEQETDICKYLDGIRYFCYQLLDKFDFPSYSTTFYFKGHKGDIVKKEKFISSADFHAQKIPIDIEHRDYSFLSASSLKHYYPENIRLETICGVLHNLEMLSVVNMSEMEKRRYWFGLGVTVEKMENACIALSGDGLTLYERAENGLKIVKAQEIKLKNQDNIKNIKEGHALELAKSYFKNNPIENYTRKYLLTGYIIENWDKSKFSNVDSQFVSKLIPKWEIQKLIPTKPKKH